MKTKKKFMLLALGIFLLILVLVSFVIYTISDEKALRRQIVGELDKILPGISSSLNNFQVSLDLIGGFVQINDFQVRGKDKKKILEIPEMKFFLKDLISSSPKLARISLLNPSLHIKREGEDINILSLFPSDQNTQGESAELPELFLENARITYEDSEILKPKSHLELSQANLRLTQNETGDYQVRGTGTFSILKRISFQGTYSPKSKGLDLKLKPISLKLEDISSRVKNWPSQLEIKGDLNFKEIHFSGLSEKEPALAIEGGISLKKGEISWLHKGERLSLEDIRARIQINPKGEVTLGAKAKFLGSTLVVKDGWANLKGEVRLPLRLTDFVLDERLVDLALKFNPSWEEDYEDVFFREIHPGGKISGDLVLKCSSEGVWDWQSKVHLDNIGLSYFDRPVTLHELTGTVEVSSEEIRLPDVSWKLGSGVFKVNPQSRLFFKSKKAENFFITFRDLEVNRGTWDSFPEVIFLWEMLWPQGVVDGKIMLRENFLERMPRIELTCHDFEATFDEVPYPAHEANGNLLFEDGCLFLQNLRAKLVGSEAKVHVNGHVWPIDYPEFLPRLDVQISVSEALINEKIPEFFRTFQQEDSWHYDVIEIWNVIRPESGKIWVNAHAKRESIGFEDPKVKAIVKFTDVVANYLEFPYPFTDGQGDITVFTGEEVIIHQASVRNKDSSIKLKGVLHPRPAGMGVDLKFSGSTVALDDDLKNAVGEDYSGVWEDLSPEGTTSLKVKISKKPEDETVSWKAVAELKDLKASYKHFPYPLENIQGTLLLSPEKFRLVDITGNNGRMQAKIEGWVEDSGALEMNIGAIDIALDEKLHQALPEEAQKIWQDFQVEGQLEAQIKITKEGESSIEWDANLQLQNIKGYYKPFPYSFDRVTGKLRISPQGVEVKQVQATKGKSLIMVEGAWIQGDLALNVAGEEIPLDKELINIMPPGLQEFLGSFDLAGKIDVEAKFAKKDGVNQRHIAIFPNQCTVTYKPFPYELINLSHLSRSIPIEIDNKYVHIRNIQAQDRDCKVFLNGRVSLEENSELPLEMQIKAQRVPIDTKCREAIAVYFPELMESMQPEGRIEELLLNIFYKRTKENELRLGYRVAVKRLTAFLHKENILRQLNGDFFLRGFQYGDKHTISGHWNSGFAQVSQFFVDNVSAEINFANNYLSIKSILAKTYKGDLKGDLTFDTSSYKAYTGAFTLKEGNLREWAKSNEKKGSEKTNLSGNVSAEFSFEGNIENPEQLTGQGQVEILDGYLWEMPIFLAMFDLLSLPAKPAFREGQIAFTLSDDLIHVNKLRFDSSLLSITGNGTLSWEKKLDLVLLTHFAPKLIPRIPILTQIWNELKRYLLGISVKGTLDEPSLNLLNIQSIQDILKESEG